MHTNLHNPKPRDRRGERSKASRKGKAPHAFIRNYALRYTIPDYVYILDPHWIGNEPECTEDLIREINTHYSIKGGWQ